MSNLSSIDVVILAGGFGKRLKSVVYDRPKVLAEVNGKPFISYLLNKLNNAGFKSVIFGVGYLSDDIKKKFGSKFKNLRLKYSVESTPLGTAGSLRLAFPFIKSKMVLVMNGDSYHDIDYWEFIKFHKKNKASISLVVTEEKESRRYGSVIVESNGEVVKFLEKKDKGSGFISAGVYLFDHSQIMQIPQNREFSLEEEVFPNTIGKNLYAYKNKASFIDIGTPESYKAASRFFSNIEKQERRFVLLDRDGTIIEEKNYLSSLKGVKLIPKVIAALKELRKMGFGLVVVTNQAGIGRGYFDEIVLEKIHQRMNKLLVSEGIVLDDIYFCPHIPEDNCSCRKPNIGMVKKAVKKHHFNPKKSFVIGDHKSDIDLGKNIGAVTFLVKTGHGMEESSKKKINADYIVDDLYEAAKVIKRLVKED